MIPWRRNRKGPSAEATDALQRAEEALKDALRDRSEVDEVTDSLRRLRERNRFADRIEALIRGEAP